MAINGVSVNNANEEHINYDKIENRIVSADYNKATNVLTFHDEEGTQKFNVEIEQDKLELDDTLSKTGFAADAKAVGDEIARVESSIPNIDSTLSTTGDAADAGATGALIVNAMNQVAEGFNDAMDAYLIENAYGQMYLDEDNGLHVSPVTPDSETVITDAVEDWLDDHPEATTTVEDGSITVSKLHENLREKIDLEPLYIHMVKGTNASSDINLYGDCTVIHGAVNGLVDMGADPNLVSLKSYLSANHISSLDFCIISHYHSDHITSDFGTAFSQLSSAVDLSDCTFYLPHGNINWSMGTFANYATVENNVKGVLTSAEISYEMPTENQVVDLGNGARARFFNLDATYYDDYYNYFIDEAGNVSEYTIYNNFSMVADLAYQERHILFSGDVHVPAQKNNYQNIQKADIYKVEHHGLNRATDISWLGAINPEFALIGSYSNNYPDSQETQMTIASLVNKGCTVLSTYDSSITLSIDHGEITKVEGIPYQNSLDNLSVFHEGIQLIKEHFADSVKTDGLIDIDKITMAGSYYSTNGTHSLRNIAPQALNGANINAVAMKLLVFKTTNNPESLIQVYIRPFSAEWFAFRKWDDNSSAWRPWVVIQDSGNIYSSIDGFSPINVSQTRVTHVRGGYTSVGEKVYVHWEVLVSGDFTFGAGSWTVGNGLPQAKFATPLSVSGLTGDANTSKILNAIVNSTSIMVTTSGTLNTSSGTHIIIHGEYIRAT